MDGTSDGLANGFDACGGVVSAADGFATLARVAEVSLGATTRNGEGVDLGDVSGRGD